MAADVEFGPVTPKVLTDLLASLRPIDRIELDCMADGDPVAKLHRSIERARRSCAVYIDGELAAVVAINSRTLSSLTGCPWALTTRVIDKPGARRVFIEGSKPVMGWLIRDFSCLWNLVAAENKTAIRWLKWLGFSFPDRDDVVICGHRFRYFERAT
ncbi:hypothetical protein [Paracoccus sp. SM22M-07]|uniref:hypothetical protein n=1 Tax=Paracoccus sp. SM22M-07 TaxID=1520813 RepID=UPI0009125EB8|nr:hypothetical protein [Paracoccus sp. SM22M-07]OJH45191.1 hypothetical protein IE00_05900 [Paracoccus sp. SM22M-07]